MIHRHFITTSAVIALCSGCAASVEPDEAEPLAPVVEEADPATTPIDDVVVQASVTDAVTGLPIERARACALYGSCTTIDGEGTVELSAVALARSPFLSVVAEGYAPAVVRPNVENGTANVTVQLVTTDVYEQFASPTAVLPYFRGLVVRTWDYDGTMGGVRIEVEGGDPLVYADETGTADPELDETTSAGYAARIGLDSGEITLTVHAPAGADCGFEIDSMMLRPSITVDLQESVIHALDVACFPNQ